jgi:hypothetical protein
MNSWKCSRARASGARPEEAVHEQALAAAHAPHMYTPRGMGGRTSSFVTALARRAL